MLELEAIVESNCNATSSAARQAELNRQQNLRALEKTQPQLATSRATEIRWVFARDGSLTAIDQSGKWHGGCSVPHRAAGELLRSLEIAANVACFLAPIVQRQIRSKQFTADIIDSIVGRLQEVVLPIPSVARTCSV